MNNTESLLEIVAKEIKRAKKNKFNIFRLFDLIVVFWLIFSC